MIPIAVLGRGCPSSPSPRLTPGTGDLLGLVVAVEISSKLDLDPDLLRGGLLGRKVL